MEGVPLSIDTARSPSRSTRSVSGWRRPRRSGSGRTARSRSRRPSTTGPSSRSGTACSARGSSGPTKDWECACGKYKRMKTRRHLRQVRRRGDAGAGCAASGWATSSWPRRSSHIWFFKGLPSRIGQLLDMSLRDLEKILYFEEYVVLDPGPSELKKKELLTDDKYRKLAEEYGRPHQGRHGRRGDPGAAAAVDLETLARRAARLDADRDVRAEAEEGRQAAQGRRGLPQVAATRPSG